MSSPSSREHGGGIHIIVDLNFYQAPVLQPTLTLRQLQVHHVKESTTYTPERSQHLPYA